jgi:hypothetical protein
MLQEFQQIEKQFPIRISNFEIAFIGTHVLYFNLLILENLPELQQRGKTCDSDCSRNPFSPFEKDCRGKHGFAHIHNIVGEVATSTLHGLDRLQISPRLDFSHSLNS